MARASRCSEYEGAGAALTCGRGAQGAARLLVRCARRALLDAPASGAALAAAAVGACAAAGMRASAFSLASAALRSGRADGLSAEQRRLLQAAARQGEGCAGYNTLCRMSWRHQTGCCPTAAGGWGSCKCLFSLSPSH